MEPGQLLGERYRLDIRIGAGGMGEVWRAEDVKLGRTVAIKALHRGLADDVDFRKRFLQEARTVAALNQPGVVNLYDTREETGPDGSRLSYLVMEFVAGRSLSRIVADRGRISPGDVMWVIAQVARGLDAAHRVGIVHRDVKPGNILVSRDGDATIVDFGIARRRGEAALTATGSVMGTVEYASPEQLQDEQLTGASDVYSLGVVAYECLTGSRPFDGRSAAAIITGHISRSPAPLPEWVPREIAQVVMRALAKDPMRRFESAGQFARACRDAANAEPPPTRPVAQHDMPTHAIAAGPADAPQPPATAESKPSRRRGLAVMVALAVITLLAATAFILWPSQDDKSGADEGDNAASSEPASPEPSEPPVAGTSVMVGGDSGLCLLMSKADGSEAGMRTSMGYCEGNRYESYEFTEVDDDIVTITFRNAPLGGTGEDLVNCMGYDNVMGIVATHDCDPEISWRFEYLRTEDSVDFWLIRSVSDDELCLQSGTDIGEPATVTGCDESAAQEWRTEAGDG